MKPVTTNNSNIEAFRTLTIDRDHNKGSLILSAGGGLACINHHHLKIWDNYHSITQTESDSVREAFAEALRNEYGAKLSALAKALGEGSQYAKILKKINDRQFGQDGELGLSRATVKATIEEIDAALAKVDTAPRQIQLHMAGTPLQKLLKMNPDQLLELVSYQDENAVVGQDNEKLLKVAGDMVTELLKTNVVVENLVNGAAGDSSERKTAIQGNCKFFALILLKFLQGLPDLRKELLDGADNSDGVHNFGRFVRLLDLKFGGNGEAHWTKGFANNPQRQVGEFSRAMLEIVTVVLNHKMKEVQNKVKDLDKNKVENLDKDDQDKKTAYLQFLSAIRGQEVNNAQGEPLTFEEVFVKDNAYDADRLTAFFSLCEKLGVDVNEPSEQ